MKSKKLSPETRRIVLTYAAQENMTYMPALECLIIEGAKAVADKHPNLLSPVCKGVDNMGTNL